MVEIQRPPLRVPCKGTWHIYLGKWLKWLKFIIKQKFKKWCRHGTERSDSCELNIKNPEDDICDSFELKEEIEEPPGWREEELRYRGEG